MIVLVDTSVWSLSLRRARRRLPPESFELTQLINQGLAAIIGPIRQEILSGIRAQDQFEILREHLRAFPDVELTAEDFELAAEFFNRCRTRGVQGANTDFLICAVAARRGFSVFTTDKNFTLFAKHVPIVLHPAVSS